MANSHVYVQPAAFGYAKQAETAVETLFSQLPKAKELSKTSKVLLKPNLLARHMPEKGVTTHPDVVRAVIIALQKRGVKHITLADSSGGPYSAGLMKAVYKASGLGAICEEFGVTPYTECNTFPAPVEEHPGRIVQQFTLLSPVREHDFIINLPKLKTHALTGMSGAVKNLFGLVPGLQKAEFHMRFPDGASFGQMLVDLCETVRADIHIVDGILGMEGDGPAGGTTRECGLLLAGEDPYLVDMALCRYIGMDPSYPLFLAAAQKNGLCPAAFDESLLIGNEEAKKPLPNFQLPRSYDGRNAAFAGRLPAPLSKLFVRLTSPRPAIKKAKCIGCGKCAEICPQKVITMQNGKAVIAYKNCIRCFCCHEMCPAKAIDIKKNPILQI